ncbi:MAG: TonB-dependent receptor [Bacteroidales bacterium]|jgi:TonB-linked SusC/RagA family outer membrane protein|nr:TonB-dependent receptor [Bacteroidales bacterium]
MTITALTFSFSIAPAQNVTVTGKITDGSNDPLPGVYVLQQGSQNGTTSDAVGEYRINVPSNSTLVFTFMGMNNSVVPVNGRQVINVKMTASSITLQDLVVVGFGTQKKANLTGAVSTVDTKALDNRPIADLSKGLQGLTPGMSITYSSGQLDNSASIRLRGIGTIVDGKSSGSPLILVDGIPTDLNMVNPQDVASISVLKDAASASIYGARAAFGVVLITTKTGKSNQGLKVSYDGNIGWNNPTKMVHFLDPVEELTGIISAADARGEESESFGMYHKTLIQGIQNWEKNYRNNRKSNEMVYGEDWENLNGHAYFYRVWDANKIMIGRNTPETHHTLQISGQLSPNSTLMASVGYSAKEGVMEINPEKMKRFNVNLNVKTQVKKWLTATFKVMSTHGIYKEPYNYYGNGYSGSESNGYFGYYMRWGEYFPYGTYKGYYFRHAPGFLAGAHYNKKVTDYIRLGTTLQAQITKDITATAEYSVANNFVNWKENGQPVKLWNFWAGAIDTSDTAVPTTFYSGNSSDNSVRVIKTSNKTQVFNAYAKYTHTFNKVHNVSAQIGFNSEWNNWERTYSARYDLLDPGKNQFGLATGDQYSYSAVSAFEPGESEYAIAGVFSRLNYNYKGKYLAEFNIRYDGSSKFPSDDQWGWFPSGSIGWRISEEPFMKDIKWIDNIKLRASLGTIGNQNVASNAFIPIMSSKNAYWLGNGSNILSITYGLPTTVSSNLTWENIVTTDIGFDFGFLNMFNATFDWYQRNTNGMLATGKALPETFGASAPLANSGNLRTRGWEFSVDFNKIINDHISVFASAGISDSRSVVTKWDNDAKTIGTIYKGMVIGEIWGLETDRIAQNSDKFDYSDGTQKINGVDQSKVAKGTFVFGPGDVIYKDLNHDKKIDGGKGTVDDHGDLKKIGNSTPRYEYNFRLGGNFYNFDVSMFFQGVGKRKYWASSDLILPFYNRYDCLYAHQSDYWTESNTNAFWPRLWRANASTAFTGVSGCDNQARQSKYLLNMAYLRLKNLTIGYSLPARLAQKIKMEKARIYFSGENLFTKQSSHLPVDPEVNQKESNWGRTFPYQKTVSFGVQITF